MSFAEGANVNKYKTKVKSEFYSSTIKVQLQASDFKNVKSVEYSLNGVTSKDECSDKDAVTGKYNYSILFTL